MTNKKRERPASKFIGLISTHFENVFDVAYEYDQPGRGGGALRKKIPSPENRMFEIRLKRDMEIHREAVRNGIGQPPYVINTSRSNPDHPKNEINTPAATAEPITPEILLAIQY